MNGTYEEGAFATGNRLPIQTSQGPLAKTGVVTSTDLMLDLADPQPEAICIEDIARGLSQHVRWAGQGRWLSVAQHSVMVMRLIEDKERKERGGGANMRLLRMALMHDAHEAYIGDMVSGLKYLLRDSVLKDLVFKLDMAIEYAIPNLDFDVLSGDREQLVWAETTLLPIEYNYLHRGIGHRLIEGPLCQRFAEELFLGEAARVGMVPDGAA